LNRFEKIWEDTNKVICRVPYTEESHQEVLRLQKLATEELEAMERNHQLKQLEVPVVA